MQPLLLPVTTESLWTATWMALAFIGVLFAGSIMMPGLERRGFALPNGETKDYRLTGMTLFFLLHIVLGIAVFGYHISMTPIVQHLWSLFIVANVIAILWALMIYAYGKRSGAVLKSEVGRDIQWPSWVKDFWFGSELNPTWLGVDLKMFMYQPSLLGVYLSFALCTGLSHWQPYLVPLSLFLLLVQRAARDEKKCRWKYGPLWEEYCRTVRFRMIPFIY